ncbi:MAG: S41 family peptidase [Planctomycetota bacterium]|jgi:C-terminal processing protease CtpA/Prc
MRIDRHVITALLAAAALQLAAAAPPEPEPRTWDFERDTSGRAPAGWFVPQAAGCTAAVTADSPAQGRQCVELVKQGSERFGNLMQAFDATPYRGSRVRFRASVRLAKGPGNAAPSRAQLWLRVDRDGGRMGFFDNMGDRPIRSFEWSEYEIVGDIDDDASRINIGLMLFGTGKVLLDDVSFEVLGQAGVGAEPARPLTDRGLANLTAFGRLLGYVRHFHPSDQAAATDWEMFAIRGVRAVEDAADADDLAARLSTLFAPVAPGVQVATTHYTYWFHNGFGQHGEGQAPARGIYRSIRAREPLDGVYDDEDIPRPGTVIERDLDGGVRCRVPICVYRELAGTLPRTDADRPEAPATFAWDPPQGWIPTGDDRWTRLAAVILAWNIFQHFYPYFDVVDTDWDHALEQALRHAAEDPDGDAFGRTLRRLVDALHDGHGRVSGRGGQFRSGHRLPFALEWVEGELVVTRVAVVDGVGPNPGDIVVSIDGRTSQQIWDDLDPLISGATEQWARYRSLDEIVVREAGAHFTAELRTLDGLRYSIRSQAVLAGPGLDEPRPQKIAEIEPGIWYVDIGRINDRDFTAALPDLERARGIVFDLRGYPRLSTIVIAHLIDEPVTCAQWHVPIVRWPDRQRMEFQFSNWQVTPQPPRLKARVAFVTDGRAISYAETYLGIIEHYELAEIVGGPTAGTNGNVNPIRLPGGYTISWTGMKVLKHDGAQHHGVGIQPTVPVRRTIPGVAEGRDELLERAVEVVRGRRSD